MKALIYTLVSGFLAATPLVTAQAPPLRAGVSVQMPITRSAVPLPDADKPDSLVLAVTADGSAYLGITPLASAELRDKVKGALSGRSGAKLYIKGDSRTPYAGMAKVLAAVREAGVATPALLTAQRDSPEPGYPVPPKGLEVLIGPSLPPASESIGVQALHAGQQPTLSVNNERTSFENLPARLRQLLQNGSRKVVVLKVDERLQFGDVVRVIDTCRSVGAKVFLAAAGPAAESPVAGTWAGQTNNLAAVTMAVNDSAGRLSGTIVFHLQIKEGDTWKLDGDSRGDLVDPKLDGPVLRFRVLRPSDHKMIRFTLTLSGNDEATLESEDLTGPDGVPPLKMLRRK